MASDTSTLLFVQSKRTDNMEYKKMDRQINTLEDNMACVLINARHLEHNSQPRQYASVVYDNGATGSDVTRLRPHPSPGNTVAG